MEADAAPPPLFTCEYDEVTRAVQLMTNRIRPYAWGSRTAIAELQEREVPSAHPEAELWIGAHPGDSSVLQAGGSEPGQPGVSLLDAVAADPVAHLGAEVASRFESRLPFLLKVLAAAEPLSLQAHPTLEQARRGFEAEQAERVPMGSAHRNYKDPLHKPELICALTEFRALCGFREPAVTVQLLSQLASPELDRYVPLLAGQPDEHGTRALFSSIISMPAKVLVPLLDSVLAACIAQVRRGSQFDAEYRTALELGERYPGDPGVLASLLLNRITLQPGEALYLGAGNLHAYLSGTGVEIMANSDNVLRGGLTPKHVDVPELMRVLDFSVGPVPVLRPEQQQPGVGRYPTPIDEFSLAVVDPGAVGPIGEGVTLDHHGPLVLLGVRGEVQARVADGTELPVRSGGSVWVAAADGPVTLSGDGRVFAASDGLTA